MGSFNGSGVFVRSYSWVQDAANGLDILANRMDTEDNGFAGGLTNCVTRDGQSPPTANLPMGNFRITGLADPSLAQDAATKNYADSLSLLNGGTITGNLAVTGNETVGGTFGVAGAATLSSTLAVAGVATFGALITSGIGVSTAAVVMEHGGGRTGSGDVHFDLHATSSSDYEARFIRSSGTNGNLSFINTGTGTLYIQQTGSAAIDFQTNSTSRFTIAADGSALAKGTLASVGAIYPSNDSAFNLSYSGGFTTIAHDTGDYQQYDRSGNVYTWYIGSTLKAYINSAGVFDGNNNELGYKDVPQNTQSGAYVLVLTDRGKQIYMTGAAAALTIPPNSSVAFPLGATIALVNAGSGARTLTQGSGVTLKWAGVGSTGNRSLAVDGLATLTKTATDTWYVSGAGLS